MSSMLVQHIEETVVDVPVARETARSADCREAEFIRDPWRERLPCRFGSRDAFRPIP